MIRLTTFILIATFLVSCTTLRIPEIQKQNIKDIGVEWNIDSATMNNVYLPKIDSTLDACINRFNKETHQFKVHRKRLTDSAYLTLYFENGRFVTNAGVALGYIISGLGLIATPIYTISSSNGNAFLAFWYFPRDNIKYSAVLSPSINSVKRGEQFIVVQSGACFSSKNARIKAVIDKLSSSFYSLLRQLEGAKKLNRRYN